jgi:hypothetical protein
MEGKGRHTSTTRVLGSPRLISSLEGHDYKFVSLSESAVLVNFIGLCDAQKTLPRRVGLLEKFTAGGDSPCLSDR